VVVPIYEESGEKEEDYDDNIQSLVKEGIIGA